MAERPDRVCVPIEMEMLPLYRDPPGSARLRRELKRQRRRERQEAGESPSAGGRIRAFLATGATAVARRRRAQRST